MAACNFGEITQTHASKRKNEKQKIKRQSLFLFHVIQIGLSELIEKKDCFFEGIILF